MSESTSSGLLEFKQDIRIPVPWGHLAAKVWGSDNGLPVLGLHGWQDNSGLPLCVYMFTPFAEAPFTFSVTTHPIGTFDTLAPLLPPTIRFVCLDFCGHGLSSPYPTGMFLNYYDHVHHIKLVIDYFKWKKVIIIGHSMGGIAALLFTSMFSELVDKLIVLDVVKQFSSSPEYLPARMKSILVQYQELSAKMEKGPPAPISYQEARDRLVKNYGGSIDEKAAEILLVRGLKKRGDNDEWEYSRDLRTIIRPYLFNDFTNEQNKAVARGITPPFLLVKAKHASSYEPKELHGEFYDIYRGASEDFRFVEVEGRHHVHLTDPELVAPHIYNFLFPLQSKI